MRHYDETSVETVIMKNYSETLMGTGYNETLPGDISGDWL